MKNKENQNMENTKSWMVAIACCILNCFLYAPYRLSGLIYVALIERYGTERNKASLPMFIYLLITSISGPVVAAVCQRFGLEETIILGTLFVSFGIGGTYFAKSIEITIIFLGIIYGIGMSFCINLISNVLKKHFTKSFNTSSGLARSGACIGAFIFPPIAITLLDNFGVSGLFLIMGGIILHSVPVAMLIKLARVDNTNPLLYSIQNHSMSKDEFGIVHKKKTLCDALDYSRISKENTSKICDETIPVTETQSVADIAEVILKSDSYNLFEAERFVFKKNDDYSRNHVSNNQQSPYENILMVSAGDFLCKKNNSKECISYLKPLTVLKEPSFLIISSLLSLHAYSLTIVWTTLIEYSRDKMIPREYEVFILMSNPVLDIIGRLGLVWIVDKGFMSYTTFAIVGNFAVGLSLVFIVLSEKFVIFMIGALLFGLSSGSLLVILPNMLFKFLPKENHVMASSCRIITYAPLCFTASPLIEYFRGELKSYDWLYCIVIVLCLLCCLATPLASRFSKVQKNGEDKSSKQRETTA